MQAFAGTPQHVWRFAGNGQIAAGGLFLDRAQAFGYGCTGTAARGGCRTVYAFRSGRLIGLFTREAAFHTQAGTSVGTGLTRALRNERRARWSGPGVQCPAILLPSSGTTEFKADVAQTPARVSDFLLTLSPQAFGDGC